MRLGEAGSVKRSVGGDGGGGRTPWYMQPFKAHRQPVGASQLLFGPFTHGGRAGTIQGPTARGHLESSQSEDSMERGLSPPPQGGSRTVRAMDEEVDVLPRPLTLGVAVTGIAHLAHRTLMLHVALDEKHTWKASLLPEDAEPGDLSKRLALIDLPYLTSGVCVCMHIHIYIYIFLKVVYIVPLYSTYIHRHSLHCRHLLPARLPPCYGGGGPWERGCAQGLVSARYYRPPLQRRPMDGLGLRVRV